MINNNKRLLLILAMLLIMILGASTMSMECETGSVCHALMYKKSTMYILCADGYFELVENGVDSWEVHCIENPRPMVYMPHVSRGR